MQKMARRHNNEGGNHLEQESNRQKATEDIDGGLHPAVDGQSLGESEGETSSSSAFPSCISGVHHFWVRFLRMWPFFNPTIKIVTLRLRGWCLLGVFLLPAFTRLGHERQDLLSPCDKMHVCTD